MAQIHIMRTDPSITVDVVKNLFKEIAPVESVEKSDNGLPDECQFHIKVKDWTPSLTTLFRYRYARIRYDDRSYFICCTL